jgi:hypothetical protein
MGDIDVTSWPQLGIDQVTGIEPVRIDQVTGVEPLRIAKIAPAAVHVKELNHVAPITIDSIRVDEVCNLEPVKVDHFDVTSLPTVNLSLGQAPALDLNLRRIPPLAVGLHQDFVMPSEYHIRARLLGFEFLRVQVTGRTVMHPRDQVPAEVSASHERSYREVAAVGNPAIPVTCREERAQTVVRRRPRRTVPRARPRPATVANRAGAGSRAGAGIRAGAPPQAFALPRPHHSAPRPAPPESSVSSV